MLKLKFIYICNKIEICNTISIFINTLNISLSSAQTLVDVDSSLVDEACVIQKFSAKISILLLVQYQATLALVWNGNIINILAWENFLYPFKTLDDFLKELFLLSELALLLVEPLEVEDENDLKELILESSLNAWLGRLNDGS